MALQEKCVKLKPFMAVIDDAIVGFAEFEPNGRIDCFYGHCEFQCCGLVQSWRDTDIEAREMLLPRVYAAVSIIARLFFAIKGFGVIKQ